MTYQKIDNLNKIEEQIIDFQSSYLEEKSNSHVVIQSFNGYLIDINEIEASTKELYSCIANVTNNSSGITDILKNDLVFLITSPKLIYSDEQSLSLKSMESIEETQVSKNIEILCKENFLNLIKV
tara:strand:- start:3100 stop:3474 length:375 start_codon:yes stop_codon:yes gene_type:complete